MVIHTVKVGESLSSIGKDYGVPFTIIAALNGLPQNAALAIGQALIIRFPRVVHTVKAGETLNALAARYGVTVNGLFRANPSLYGGESISPGQSLVISYEDTPEWSFTVGGYAYPFTPSELINQTMPFINVLIPFTYGFREDGSLYSLEASRLIAAAERYGAETWMHLSTYTEGDRFDTALATALLSDPELQARLAQTVLKTIEEQGYSGLDVDFEFIGKENAAAYAAFLGRLTALLNPQGYSVTAALAPKTSAEQVGSLYEGHDYGAVAAAVNSVLLMTYEWGYTFGSPLAVSPLPSVRRVLDYALTEMSADKIFLGISNYGYDWTLPYNAADPVGAPSLSAEAAVALAVSKGVEIMYDTQAQAPYFNYTEDGVRHEVWFEDVRSIYARLGLVSEYGLRGALYWNFTRPNTSNLSLLAAVNQEVNKN